jgi:hypothetical protein
VEDRKIKTRVATHKSQQSKISQIKYINEIVKFILQVTTDAAEIFELFSYMEVKATAYLILPIRILKRESETLILNHETYLLHETYFSMNGASTKKLG